MKTIGITLLLAFTVFAFSSPAFARCVLPAVDAPNREACSICGGLWAKARLKMWGFTQEEKRTRRDAAYEWLYSNKEWKRNKCVLNTVTRAPSYDDLKRENEYLENELNKLQRQLDKN